MTSHHYPAITDEEKLGKIVEEAGEVITELGKMLKAYGKFRRHGWTPKDARTGISYNNAQDMFSAICDAELEIKDLLASCEPVKTLLAGIMLEAHNNLNPYE